MKLIKFNGCIFLILICLVIIQSNNIYAVGNNPPILNNSDDIIINTITEDDTDNTGMMINDMISGRVSDNDGDQCGVAIIGVEGSGNWEYYDNSSWWSIQGVTTSKVLLLKPDSRLRFIPSKDWFGTASIKYLAWDRTIGTCNVKYNISDTDTAFSSDYEIANVIVESINDSPVIKEAENDKLLYFDGTNDYIQFPDIDLGSSFTYEGWIKADKANNYSRFFDCGKADSEGMADPNYNLWCGFIGGSGHIGLEAYAYPGNTGSNKPLIETTGVFPLNTWVHVAVVYDENEKEAYIYQNGQLITKGPMDLTLDEVTVRNKNFLGKSNWEHDQYFSGYMKDIRMWSTAKTLEEIQTNINRTLIGDEKGLLLYYPLVNGNESVVEDLAGMDHNGNIEGASWIKATGINTNLCIEENQYKTLNFQIADVDSELNDLEVTCSSSNTSLVPNENLICEGTGENRQVKVTPTKGLTGNTTITITVSDGHNTTCDTFEVSVYESDNEPPIAGFVHALHFDNDKFPDNNDQYVTINDFLSVNDEFTIETWVKVEDESYGEGFGVIVGSDTLDKLRTPSLWTRYRRHGHAGFGTGDTWCALYKENVLVENQWNHIAYTHDGTFSKLYVNGILADEKDFSGESVITGSIPFFGKGISGNIDEVRIYNIALSEENIREWMNRPITENHPKYDNLEGYWELNKGSGMTALDTCTNHNGTLRNMDENSWIISTVTPRYLIKEGESIPVYFTGYDADGDNLDYVIVDNPCNGEIQGIGSEMVYFHNGSETLNDYFTYKAIDGTTDSINEVKVYLTIEPVNDSPTADEQHIELQINTSYSSILSGSDPENQNLTYEITKNPENGSVNIETNGVYTYIPNQDFIGTDEFMFCTNDGLKSSIPAKVSIVVDGEICFLEFDTNGGNGVIEQILKEKDSIIYLPDASSLLSKTGYTFSGWNTHKDGMGQGYNSEEEFELSSNIILYAQWKPKEYILTYCEHDDPNFGHINVTYDKIPDIIPTPQREGYEFIYWQDDEGITYATDLKDFVMPAKNITLTAIYSVKTYTVTFKDWNNDILITEIVAHGSSVIEPDDPIRVGYAFIKWDKDLTNITSDLTIMALYNTNSYTVEYKAYNGEIISSQTLEYGIELTYPPNPEREGYTFVNWNKNILTMPDENIEIKAIYDINQYTVTYIDYNENEIKSETLYYGTNLSYPPNPEREGYIFTGWDKNIETVPPHDITITAQYTSLLVNKTDNNKIKANTEEDSFDVGTKKTTYSNGQKEIIVEVDSNSLEKELEKLKENTIISIPIVDNTDIATTQFSVQDVKNMQEKEVILTLNTDKAIYNLPTTEVDVSHISNTIGKEVKLSDILFNVSISKADDNMVHVVKNTSEEKGLAVIVPPVDFAIKATYQNRSVTVEKFNSYIERMIEIPKGVDYSKITTAIVTEKDGTLRHIPTYITIKDGKYYATINSLTNSTYTLIYNKETFIDVLDSYWAKNDIEKMASRLIVEGKDDGTFDPEENITKEELAEILVKSMGLKPEKINKFVDVDNYSISAGYIGTAYTYGIIDGTNETTFSPRDYITRQDVMTVIYKMSKIVRFTGEKKVKGIIEYEDFSDVSDYAKEAVKWNVENGIVKGKSKLILAPFDKITREEITVIVNRFLMSAGLID